MKDDLSFRDILEKDGIITLPGVYDCLSARIAQNCGFSALFTSGFGISASSLGLPDYGLITGTEMIQSIARIKRSVSVPVVADIDTGYGNPLNVIRTVEDIVSYGISGIILEDQKWPKRCGHLEGKEIIETNEHVEKIKAARYAASESDLVIIARTDSRAVHGLDEALERGRAYIEAGADVLFIEAPESVNELRIIADEFQDIYLFANMVEGGKTPVLSSSELQDIGFKIVVYPLAGLFSSVNALKKTYEYLMKNDTTSGYEFETDFDTFKEVIGIDHFRKLEKKFVKK